MKIVLAHIREKYVYLCKTYSKTHSMLDFSVNTMQQWNAYWATTLPMCCLRWTAHRHSAMSPWNGRIILSLLCATHSHVFILKMCSCSDSAEHLLN